MEAVRVPRGLEVQVAAALMLGEIEATAIPVPVAYTTGLVARLPPAELAAAIADVVPVVPTSPTDARKATADARQAASPTSTEITPSGRIKTAGATLAVGPFLGHPRAASRLALLILRPVTP